MKKNFTQGLLAFIGKQSMLLICFLAYGLLVNGQTITYTWVGGFGTGSQQSDFQQAANWNPSRGIPSTQDVLQFTNNTANTVTNVPTQTIARLVLTGTTAVSLQAVSGSSTTLSVGFFHTNGADEISVPSGCTLTLANNADGGTGNIFTLGLAKVANVTSNIAGTLTIEPNVTVTESGASTYSNNTAYTLNQLVINRGNLYKVTTAGTSAASGTGPSSKTGTSNIDGTGTVYFSYIGSQYSVTYSTGTTYSLGQLVNNGGNLYQVTTSGTAALSGSGPTVTTGSVIDGGMAGNQVFTYVGSAVSGNYASAYSNVYDVHYGITTVSGTVNYAGKFNNTSVYTTTTTNTLQFVSGSNFNNQRFDAAFPGANTSHSVTLSPYYNNVNVTISGAAGSTSLTEDQFPSSVNSFNVVTPYLNGGTSSSAVAIYSLSNNGGTFYANSWNEAMTGIGLTEVIFGSKIANINIGSGGVNISSGIVYFANGYSQAMNVTGDFTLSGTGGFVFKNGTNTATLTVNNFTHSGSDYFQLNNTLGQTGATLTVNGNFNETTSGGFLSKYPCTLMFSGNGKQTFYSRASFGSGISLAIANTGITPNNTVTLKSKFTVGGTLTLASGLLVLDSNYLTLGNTASISPVPPTSASYIDASGTGLLTIDSVPATGNTIFPIGTATSYTPLTFTGGTAGANISVGVKNVFTNTVLSSSKVVNLQWSILANLVTQPTVTFQYNGANQASDFTSTGAILGTYSGKSYSESALGSVSGSDPYTVSKTFTSNLPTKSASLYGIGDVGAFSLDAVPVNSILTSAIFNNKVATITWNTIGEIGESYFEVEKSTDGNNFTSIGHETAKNTATASYTATDKDAVSTTTYYRIKAVSLTGAFSYSNVTQVRFTENNNQFTVYPNPMVGKTLYILLGNVNAGKYVVSIYNTLGQKVNEEVIKHEGGSVTHRISIANALAAGNYSVTIRIASSKQIVHQSSLVVN